MTEENTELPARYPSDLTNEEWEILRPILEMLDPYKTGRRRTSDLREILNAIFYLNKTGCPWRYLPTDLPPYKLVNYYYNKWTESRMLETVNTVLRQRFRERKDRNPDPTGAIIDSQSVKGTPESFLDSGFDGGKLVKGRKRHIVVDTIGCLLVVWVHAANMFDGKAARQVITNLFFLSHTVKMIWTDCGYSGAELLDWVFLHFKCDLTVVKKKIGYSRFSYITSPLGGGTNVCMAWSIASVKQRLRAEANV